MMRPEKKEQSDMIDELLEQTWENPPAHLQAKLTAIPTQVNPDRIRRLDRFAISLNFILLIWGIGMSAFFWDPIENLILLFAQSVLNISTLSPGILAQPNVGLIALVGLLLGGVWLDMEKHPRTM